MKKHSDIDLVRLINKGGRKADKAFTELYYRYEGMLFRFCYFMLNDRDAAEDVFQETFLRFVRKVDAEIKNSNVKAFLFTIARNLCINYNKRQIFDVDYEITENTADTQNNDYENKELYDMLMTALDLLESKYKNAFILREIEGLSYKDIGEALEISWSGAQSRVTRAKEKLLKILDPYIKDLQ